MVTTKDLLEALALEVTGSDRFVGQHVPSAHGVVFGGQLLAQAIVAAGHGREDMAVKTIHTVFARSASPDQPVEIEVDRMHSGRTFASRTVTISQGERLCTRSIVLLDADDPDLIRHADAPEHLPPPEEAVAMGDGADGSADGEPAGGGWEIRVVGGVDINDPGAVGPAELDVWTRFVGAPEDPAISQAMLAFASDGFLIGTAMRPHAGVGQAQAHRTLSTGVVSHTLTFHEPFWAGDWLLAAHRSPYAGRGRSYGRADVFRADGQLVASYVQDAMIRAMPDRGSTL
jgi:acyl-CoA thioesterase II